MAFPAGPANTAIETVNRYSETIRLISARWLKSLPLYLLLQTLPRVFPCFYVWSMNGSVDKCEFV